MQESSKKPPHISPQMFYKYLACPHWIWFDLNEDETKKGELSELQQKLLEQGVSHEREYIATLTFIEVKSADPKEAFTETMRLMREGAPRIYQGYLVHGEFAGRPDLLERREMGAGSSPSLFGDFHYVPIDIKSSKELKTEHKFQLVLYALMLEAVQGVKPKEAGIIAIDGTRHYFEVTDFEKKFYEVLAAIKTIFTGLCPPLQLTKKCLESPWRDSCINLARSGDDIALLYKVDRRSLAALREHGVHTVDDARVANVNNLDGSIPFLRRNGLERMKLQAESLKTRKIFVRETPELPQAALEIYFDIEGDPLLGIEYLFGFLICEAGREEYKAFVAERPEDEKKMWIEFLAWVETLPEDYVVYHYATYERGRITMLTEKYGGSAALKKFQARLFDLNETIKECFVFPLYFYGLKDVGKFLKKDLWRNKKAGGAQSIFWYEEWLKSGDRGILETIIEYNEDDVRATKFLKEWIETYRKVGGPFSHYD